MTTNDDNDERRTTTNDERWTMNAEVKVGSQHIEDLLLNDERRTPNDERRTTNDERRRTPSEHPHPKRLINGHYE